jgi:hypothetical protein
MPNVPTPRVRKPAARSPLSASSTSGDTLIIADHVQVAPAATTVVRDGLEER